MAKVNPIQLQKFLKGVDYPVKKQILLDHAKRNGADDNVMQALQNLPDKNYEGPTGIAKEIGKMQ